MKELKVRKIALKKELEQIQGEIESSLSDVRHSVANRARIRYWVDKYPLHLVGSALLTGLILARRGSKRTENSTPDETQTIVAEPHRNTFTSLLMHEFKKLVTQRAVRHVMQRVEDAIDKHSKKEE